MSLNKALLVFKVFLMLSISGFGQSLGQSSDLEPQLKTIQESNFEIGLKSGITGHLMSLDPQPPDNVRWEWGPGFATNLHIKVGSNTGIALRGEPGYLRKQSRLVQPQRDSTFFFTYQMNYISLPFYGTYQGSFNDLFGKVFQQFYISGGWSFNFLIDAQLQVDNENIDFAQIEYINDQVNPLEMAFLLNGGTRFIISKSSSLYLEVKTSQGISDLNSGLPAIPSAFEVSHFGLSFYVGFTTSISPASDRESKF